MGFKKNCHLKLQNQGFFNLVTNTKKFSLINQVIGIKLIVIQSRRDWQFPCPQETTVHPHYVKTKH